LGVSLIQWNALREIERNPGLSQHRLAQLSFNSDQAFGTLTNRLIQRGLIVRESGPGRAVAHKLTPLGTSLCSQGAEIHARIIANAFAPLGASDRDILFALLSRLLKSGR